MPWLHFDGWISGSLWSAGSGLSISTRSSAISNVVRIATLLQASTISDEKEKKMSIREQYAPGPAMDAQVQKGSDTWTLILVRNLRHPPALVWQALIDPAQLREWAPFEADGNLARPGATVKLTWVATGNVTEAQVTRAEAPRILEFHNIRWQLEPLGEGTRLTLWQTIPPRYISWGAAGWHIAFDVLDRLLAGTPIGRIAGAEATKFDWQRLVGEYAKQFGNETPGRANKLQS